MIAISHTNTCRGCDNTCCGSLCPERMNYDPYPIAIQTILPVEKIKEKSYTKFVGKSPWEKKKKGRY